MRVDADDVFNADIYLQWNDGSRDFGELRLMLATNGDVILINGGLSKEQSRCALIAAIDALLEKAI